MILSKANEAELPKSKGLVMELHVHTFYSDLNPQAPDYAKRFPEKRIKKFPLDSPIKPEELLEKARLEGLNAVFITDHDTRKGYFATIKLAKMKYPDIKVYPGEEISVILPNGRSGHILGLGITKEIAAGLSAEETIRKIHKQGGMAIAAHPYAVDYAIRDKAQYCDAIEAFNSNNLDKYSNIRAYFKAVDWKKPAVVGSDAHVIQSIGRSTIKVFSKNNLADIIKNIKKANFEVVKTAYTTIDELHEQLCYKLSEPKYLLRRMRERGGRTIEKLVRYLIKSYLKNPNVFWTKPAIKIFQRRLTQLSKKINIFESRNVLDGSWKYRILESFKPNSKKGPNYARGCNMLAEYNFKDEAGMLNKHNKSLRI